MKNGIVLSSKHGVNPSIPICFFCGKEKNEIILFGRLPEDKEAPMSACYDHEPCDECKKYMEIGVILVSVKDGESGKDPYRTGGWWVIKAEAVQRIFDEEVSKELCEKRFGFIEEHTAREIGLYESI